MVLVLEGRREGQPTNHHRVDDDPAAQTTNHNALTPPRTRQSSMDVGLDLTRPDPKLLYSTKVCSQHMN